MCLSTCSITDVSLGMATMTELEFVDLSGMMMVGPLDTACGLASTDRLRQLNLAQNALSGEIPACLLGMSSLAELHLDQNLLQGPVPAIPSSTPLVYFTAAEQVRWIGFPSFPPHLPLLLRLSATLG
jgi:hypothetical protein